jgi:1,4-dihydroxy-2-naphthoyl-CoA hydrolase
VDEPRGLDVLLGFEHLDAPDGEGRARVKVDQRLLQPYGNVHGGVHNALAEDVASRATDDAVKGEGMAAMGQSVQTTFLRPVAGGYLNATGVARHRGRTTWVWDVELADDEGRVCALSRVVVAVRPLNR